MSVHSSDRSEMPSGASRRWVSTVPPPAGSCRNDHTTRNRGHLRVVCQHMRHLRLSVLFAFVLTLVALVPPGSGTAAAEPAYSVTTLHFKVVVGPANDQACDVVGD